METIGQGILSFGNDWNAYQQSQQYEHQLVAEFVTGKYNQNSSKNQLQRDIEENLPDKQPDKDENVLEIIGEGFQEMAQLNYSAYEMQLQAEEEKRQAYCEVLEEHETELKFAAGGAVIVGTGAIAVVSHGAVSQPLIGSIIGGIVGGFIHYALAEEGEDAIDEAADGFMWGTINGAACASVGQFLGVMGASAAVSPLVLSKPETSPFKTIEVNGSNVINGEGAWLRDVDTEYKILSDIQSKLGNNYSASGEIKLYTELEPCPSCLSVIEQFKEMYPNIDIQVIYSIEK